MRIQITTDFSAVQRRLNQLAEGIRNRVTARVLNRTAEIAKTDASRSIRATYNLSAAKIRERLVIYRARPVANKLSVALIARGSRPGSRAMNVTAFAARQTKKGATIKIKRAGPRRRPQPEWAINAAFILNVPGRPVVARYTEGRNKLRGVTTIDVPQMFTSRAINRALRRTIRDHLPKIADREIRFELSRAARATSASPRPPRAGPS